MRTRVQRPDVMFDPSSETQQWFELLQQLALSASQASEFEPVLHETVRLVCAYTNWPVGHVYLADADGTLQPTEIWFLSDQERYAEFRRVTSETSLETGRGLPGVSAQQRGPVWMDGVSDDPNFPRSPAAAAAGLGAAFAFPVFRGEQLVAVVEFFSTAKSPPDSTVLSFARFAGTLLGGLLERLEAERNRRASEQMMQQVVESSPEAFVAIGPNGRIREWNPAAEKTFGYSRAEVLDRSLAETIIPPAYRDAHNQGVARVMATGVARVLGKRLELPGLRKDGSEIPLELTISEVQTSNGRLFHAFLRDITERKRAEAALNEGQRRLDEVQRLAHIGSWEWDIAGNRVSWSDELFDIYGLSRDVNLPTFEGYLERVHQDDRGHVEEMLGIALRQRTPFSFEERIVRPDGEIRILQSRGEVVVGADGKPSKLVGSCHDITEIRRAARDAEELGRRLQTILDTVAEGICGLDAQGAITFINHAGARLLGWNPAELIGRDHHEAFHTASRSVAIACQICRTLADGNAQSSAQESFEQRTGDPISLAFTATPIREGERVTGAVVTFRDLSEQRRAENEARRALMELVQEQAARAEAESMRVQLHRLFEQAPATVALTYGPDHVFELANPRYVELVGGRDIVGKPVRAALPEVVDQGFVDLLDNVYRSGQPYIGNEVPVTIQGKGGAYQSKFFNFVYQPLLGADNKSYGILVHAVDVTDQVMSRQQVEEKAAELAALAAKLERTNRELDQFAYIASHDLKAPLRGVSNIASWLEEDLSGKLTDETRDYVALMKSRVARMEDLINALLTYSRAGRVRGEPTIVDTRALVTEIAEMLRSTREGVEIIIEGELPTLFVDPVGFQQIFQNLLGNAIKYASSTVRVGAQDDGDAYRFYATDDGPGIDPRFHDRIWGMFQRLHAPGEGEGTGIGLAIVRKIAEANHAETWVESEIGAGATFYVRWPKHRDGDIDHG